MQATGEIEDMIFYQCARHYDTLPREIREDFVYLIVGRLENEMDYSIGRTEAMIDQGKRYPDAYRLLRLVSRNENDEGIRAVAAGFFERPALRLIKGGQYRGTESTT